MPHARLMQAASKQYDQALLEAIVLSVTTGVASSALYDLIKRVVAKKKGGHRHTHIEESKKAERTENILRCIDYSHSNLSPDAQRLLLCLAPFTSVIWQDMLDDYTTSLRQQPALVTLPFERWSEVIREARDWGLLSF